MYVLIALKTNSHPVKWECSAHYLSPAGAPQAMKASSGLLQSPVPGQPATLHAFGTSITAKK